jgi:hypothetical protein
MKKNLWKLINGQPVNVATQKTGTLRNGYTVSGYYALSDDILRAEGWKPLTVEQMPEIEGVQYEAYYEETETEIRRKWRIAITAEV